MNSNSYGRAYDSVHTTRHARLDIECGTCRVKGVSGRWGLDVKVSHESEEVYSLDMDLSMLTVMLCRRSVVNRKKSITEQEHTQATAVLPFQEVGHVVSSFACFVVVFAGMSWLRWSTAGAAMTSFIFQELDLSDSAAAAA